MATRIANRILAARTPTQASPLSISGTQILPFLVPFVSKRHGSAPTFKERQRELVAKAKRDERASAVKKKDSSSSSKKKKSRTTFTREDIKGVKQYSLCDAMRYLQAFEVGRPPTSPKYELAISLRTLKNGPVVRNRLRLPHVIDTSLRIAVICPPDSKAAIAAKKAGASLVGEEVILDAIQEGRIEFERLLCHENSLPKLMKANLGRILGPKGLMPSPKTGTVTKDVASSVKNLVGATEYREKMGVVRTAIGQIGFTPEQMKENVQTFMASLKKDLAGMTDRISKEIHEVVLSSTNGPGIPLNGDFKSALSLDTKELSVM